MKTVLFSLLLSILFVGCSNQAVKESCLIDETALELIDNVSQAVILLPDMPHERTRNRELSHLITLLIDANAFEMAERWIKELSNWRAEELSTMLAIAYLEDGRTEKAEQRIKEVELLAETVMGLKSGEIKATGEYTKLLDAYDDFRIERIKVGLAKYYLLKNEKKQAELWVEGVLPSERAAFSKASAESVSSSNYEAALAINALLVQGEIFEGRQAGVGGMVRLHEQYYEDEAKRIDLENRIADAIPSMPIIFRVDWALTMAETAYKYSEIESSNQFFEQARLLLANNVLRPRLFFPLQTNVIKTGLTIGKGELAIELSHALYDQFYELENGIFNIHRADVLVACAESFAYVGLHDLAEEAYVITMEKMVINPNSRPRIEDLTVLMRSIVKSEIEVSKAIIDGVEKIILGLGDPW